MTDTRLLRRIAAGLALVAVAILAGVGTVLVVHDDSPRYPMMPSSHMEATHHATHHGTGGMPMPGGMPMYGR